MNLPLRWLLLATAAVASADNKFAVLGPWQVQGEVQIVRLPAQRAVPLVIRFTDYAPGADTELQGLLAAGTATLAHHLFVRTSNGVRCSQEVVERLRYPTEFAPINPAMLPPAQRGKKPASLGVPMTAFETRDVGPSLDFEPFVRKSGSLVLIRIALNLVDFSGMQRFEGGVTANGARIFWEQPIFHTRRDSAQIVVRSGEPFLLGCCTLEDDRRTVELHILKVHIRPDAATVPPPLNQTLARAAEGMDSQTRFEIFRFIVPELDALRMRPGLMDSKRVEAEFAALLSAIKSGGAELAGVLSSPSLDGERSEVWNNREQRYASEFLFRDTPPGWVASDLLPTAVERRDVGEYLDFETKPGEAGRIAVDLRLESVGLRGFTRWPAGPDPFSGIPRTYCYRPNFLQQRTTTATPINRQRTLLRFHKLPAPDGRIEIALIRPVIEHFALPSKP